MMIRIQWRRLLPALALAAALTLSWLCLRWSCCVCARAAYPRPYTAAVHTAAAEYAVPLPLIYAVARTESGFRTDAQSPAGAVGLMQLTPDTFAWVQSLTAEEESLPPASLTDPALNIRYGTMTLSLLLEEFGNVNTALAAYNAGRTRVRGWLDDPRYSRDSVTLHTIPYPETRTYVQRVRAAEEIYKKLYNM